MRGRVPPPGSIKSLGKMTREVEFLLGGDHASLRET